MNTEKFLKKMVEFDKKYTAEPTVDDGTLTIEALREVYRVISSFCDKLNEQDGFFIDLPNTVNLHRNNPDDEWNKWRDKSGRTWVKRYRDYVRSISGGVVLPSALMGEVGETCARVRGTGRTSWTFDFHAGIDWSPGDYGESDESCLWGSYNLGRLLASKQGLCAIRFYDGNRGVGRALLWLTEDGLLHLFNLYHDDGITRESVANMLTKFFDGDWAYRNCDLVSRYLYINGESSVGLYDKNVIDSDSVVPCGSVEVEQIIDGIIVCTECHKDFSVEQSTFTHDENYVCSACLARFYTRCKRCGEWLYHFRIGHNGCCMWNDACSAMAEAFV